MSTPRHVDDAHQSAGSNEPRISRRLLLKSSGAAAATAAGAAATPHVLAQEGTPGASPASMTADGMVPAIKFFTDVESAMVDALTARILPGTADDPGAHEAGVVYYIDDSLAGANEGYTVKTYTQGPYLAVTEQEAPVESTSRTDLYRVVPVASGEAPRYGYQSVLTPQDIYRRGLESVETWSQATFNASFVDLTAEQQDSVLADMESGDATGFDAPSGPAFFTKLRNDTIEGMFSDPMYGGNRDMVGWKLISYPGARGYYTAQEMADTGFSSPPVSLADMSMHGH